MKLKASEAGHFMACAGAPQLQKQFPEPEGQDKSSAKEGAVAHWIAEQWLQGINKSHRPDVLGGTAPNGVIITTGILDAVAMYVQAVYNAEPPVSIHVENKVHIPEIDNVAIPDLFYFKPGELVIWDFKYGRTVVEVFKNWQMICYALTLNVKYKAARITFYVAQPRAFHSDGPVRKWSFNADQLPAFREELIAQVALIHSETPPTVAGFHCKQYYCTVRHACVAVQRGASLDVGLSQVNAPTPAELGVALTFAVQQLALVKAWESGLKAHAEALVKAGTTVAGWAMKSKQGTVKWAKPLAEIKALGAMFGKTVTKKEEAITPGQAMKLGIPESMVKALSKRFAGIELKAVDMDKVADSFKTE